MTPRPLPVPQSDAGRWPAGFDPENLGREASLNKLVVGPDGRNGGDLLGRDAIVDRVWWRCRAAIRPDAVTDWLIADPAAGPVVDEIGDRLASLIAALRSPATAAAATGGRRTYLQVWPYIGLVVLGGGLMKGSVGVRVAARASIALGASPEVRVASHPEWLPLIGAARSAPAADADVIVMDAGQTSIKQGVAVIRDRRLVGVRVLPSLPVASVTATDLPAVLARAVHAVRERHPGTAPEVVVSVASYLDNGRPIHDPSSIYERVDPALMRSRFGVRLRLIHDGTAAWRAWATDGPSAVIMLGTWLGVGIGPHRQPLRPYAEDFGVSPY